MISSLRNVLSGNTGIVPPYIPTNWKPANGNTGIVPPYIPTNWKPANPGNTGIVPPYIPTQGTQGNTGVVPPAGIFTSPMVQAAVQSRVAMFTRGVVPPMPCSAPMNPERFPSMDVTPKGLMGVDMKAYAINGRIMLAEQPVVPGAQPTWYDLGAIPAFA